MISKLKALKGEVDKMIVNLDKWSESQTLNNISNLAHLNITEAKRAFLNQTTINTTSLEREIKKKKALYKKEIAEYEELMESINENNVPEIYPAAFTSLADAIKVWLGAQFIICLLYTSPSPRDRQKSRMPSSA